MSDARQPTDEGISRRRVLAIGGGAVLAAAGVSGGLIQWARLEAAGRGAPAPARAAATLAPTAPPTATPAQSAADDEPWPPPPLGISTTVPTEFVFVVAPDVPEAEERLARESAALATRYYRERTGFYLTNRPRIHLNMSRTSGPLGEADGRDITLLIGNRNWPRLTRVDKVAVVCHEVFHLFQVALGEGATSPILWLIEGAAEYASQMAVIESGMRSKTEFEGFALRAVSESPQPPLAVAGRSPFATEYALGALAASQLVGDRGVPPLSDYYRRLVTASPLQAFEAAFGETRTAFEQRFEAWRVQRGIPAR
ncbi:MAG: hypothetical protein AB7G21_08005 [Dehalococcoidia bacterium]